MKKKQLQEFSRPIAEELEVFDSIFRSSMKSRVPLLNRITDFLARHKGKQLRPLFVLLSARLYGPINDHSYHAAAMIELLHTGTLIHDDVVDDAIERRGFFSVYALWKKKAAVLIGDYLLAKGLLLAIDNEEYGLLKIMSRTVKEMSEGELLQIEKSRFLNLSESEYFKIIEYKTASLIAASCAAGGASTAEDPSTVDRMHDFGLSAGIAFQIKDDLLDYGYTSTGKPKGNDLQEKKLTLPLIHALENCSPQTKKSVLRIVKRKGKARKDIEEVTAMIADHNGFAYAEEKLQEYLDRAKNLLSTVPDSDAKTALFGLCDFIAYRTK